MESAPQLQEGQKRIGKYIIHQTLGSGATCKVKLCVKAENGHKYAIKIIHNDLDDQMKKAIQDEVDALQEISAHKNIVRMKKYKKGGKYEKMVNGQIVVKRKVDYLILDLALGGELFDFISNTGPFDEKFARHYFSQLIKGLDHVHRKGFAHRDLKPENILLDENYRLKIADFGFSGPIEGRDGQGFLSTYLGTMNYMAPEIHLGAQYKGRSVDLFSAAIILFIMVAGHPPFTFAQSDDPYYKCIAANRGDWYWKLVTKGKPDDCFSDDFKDLIISMLQLDPVHRPSMSEIVVHPWLKGNQASEEEINKELQRRISMLDEQKQDELKQKNDEKMRAFTNSRAIKRGGPHQNPDDIAPHKMIDSYVNIFETNTHFFSTCNPDIIEDALKRYLHNKDKTEIQKLDINEKKYKYKFMLTSKDQNNKEQSIDMVIKILKIDENSFTEESKEAYTGNAKYCIEFSKTKGSQYLFYQHYNDLVKNALNFANNASIKKQEDDEVQEGMDNLQIVE